MSTDPWGHEIEDGSTGYHGIFAISRPLDGDQPKTKVEQERYIALRSGNKEYLLNISLIREIIMLPKITYVPHGPRYIEGVINLRGTIIPVINLKKMLGESRSEPTLNTRVLICEEQETSIKTGILVDSISVVMGLSKEDVDTSSPPLAASGHDLMDGLSKQGKNLLGILNLSKVIAIAAGDSLPLERHEDSEEYSNAS